MKRALGLLCLTWLSCTTVETQTPRRYQCDPDVAASCPGGWLCTRDGFCTNPDAGLDVSCREKADCPGGWLCARTRRCVDPTVGLPLPCESALDCPGQWKCGQIKQCLDPDAGAAWPCTTRDDCTGGWQCGLNGVCYDLTSATGVECARDAGTEYCAAGWRCGLDGRCHDSRVGAPLPCAVNEDCDQTWRCAATGHCVDFAGEQQEATGDAGPSARNSDLVPPSVEVVASTSMQSRTQRALAFWGADTLTLAVSTTTALDLLDTDAGPRPGARFIVPNVPGVTAMSFARIGPGDTSYGLWLARTASDGGTLDSWQVDALNGPSARTTLATPFTVRHLRTFARGVLGGFDDAHLQVWLADGGSGGRLDVAPGTRITDVVLLTGYLAQGENGNGTLLVVTTAGLTGAAWSDDDGVSGGWKGVALGGQGTNLVERIALLEQGQQIALLRDDAGVQFARLDSLVKPMIDGGLANQPNQLLCVGGVEPERFAGTRGMWAVDQYTLVTAVDTLDGGLELFRMTPAPVGSSSTGRFPISAVVGSDDRSDEFVVVTPEMTATRGSTSGLLPLSISTRITAAMGRGERTRLSTADRSFQSTKCTANSAFCLSMQAPASCVFDREHVLWCQQERTSAAVGVNDRPDWAISDLRKLAASTKFVLSDESRGVEAIALGHSKVDLGIVKAAVGGDASDGGTLVLVGGSDRLFFGVASPATEMTPLQPQGAEIFRFATTPVPGGQISSLALGARGPAERFASGALISSGRPFLFGADNDVVWRTRELQLSTTEAVRTWADAGRLRVLFRDGSITAIPSQVPITPPLANAETVVDTAVTCSEVFVLTATRVLHLAANPDGTGQWEPLTLTGTPSLGSASLYAWSSDAGDGELLVSTGRDGVWRVPLRCARR